MGGVDVNRFPGKSCCRANMINHGIEYFLDDAAVIDTHKDDLILTAGKSQSIDLQIIQHTVCFSGNIVTGHTDSQHGSHI